MQPTAGRCGQRMLEICDRVLEPGCVAFAHGFGQYGVALVRVGRVVGTLADDVTLFHFRPRVVAAV